MKITQKLLLSAMVIGFGGSAAYWAVAQQSAKPAEELPDAPQATAAALIQPNGPTVVMDTSMGQITCKFYQRQAPKAVANFIALAEGTKDWTDPATKKIQHHKPFYDGTTFHRVIPDFMIQGGDPLGTGMGDPGYTFNDEFDPNLNFDAPGKLAMANSGPNTNGSQFFITEAAYDSLNQHYTLFGQCDESSVLVVKAIARVERDGQDKPLTPVVLKKVTIVREGQALPPKPGEAQIHSGDIHIIGMSSASNIFPDSNTAWATSAANAVAISPEIAKTLLISDPAPVYPAAARQAGIKGVVVLDVIIGTDGAVKNISFVSGPSVLIQPAFDSVKKWQYHPYLVDRQPLAVKTQISVNFPPDLN